MEQQKNQVGYEDEIDLMDYVKIILKRKWLIFSVFLLAVIAAGIFSFISPKIYEIDTTFQVGIIERAIGVTPDRLIEAPIQLKEKIKGDVYEIKIREKLNIPEGEWPKIKVENPKNTSLIRMIIESPDPQKAKTILREINKIILAEHQEKTEVERELVEKNIKTEEGKIKLAERDIERVRNKIIFSEEGKENLEEQVRALEQVLIFEQTPGTQFALFNARVRLANKGRKIENLHLRIISLEVNIKNLNAQINSLKASLLRDITSTKVIRIPTASEAPIKPRPLLNIAIAGILGLFMGTFLAFGREWYARSK